MTTAQDVSEHAGKLAGKVAVITGGSSGMGLATARLFRDHGAHVYVTGRDQDRLDAAVAELGERVVGVRADSGDLDDLDRLFATVASGHGRVDVLFANAGVAAYAPMTEITPEAFDAAFAVNARGTFFTAQKAVNLMPDGGSIILGGTSAHRLGLVDLSAYGASKAAVAGVVGAWANELAGRRIRVNVLTIGSVDTPPTLGLPDDYRRQFAATVPLGRWGRVDEIARAALFLAGDDSSYVNATELVVDGGKERTRPL